MDVTISQFILEEFDVNCSLLDRLHETFLESSSIPFLGFDGRKRYLVQGSGKASEVLRFGLFCDAKWVAFVLSQLLLLPLSRFVTPGPYCNATTDQIGTCWPRTSAGELVERPCPEFFNGIKYNTTSKYKLLAFSRRSRVQKAPGDTQNIFPLRKKKIIIKEKKLLAWEPTFPPHSSLYIQTSCLE